MEDRQAIVTVIYDPNKHIDLSLPIDIPSQVLATAIAQVVKLRWQNDQTLALFKGIGKESQQIDATRSLARAGVMYGDYLELRVGKPSTPIHADAYLQSADGDTFPVGTLAVLVGRNTPLRKVDIDLTRLDVGKYVSRSQAIIEKEKDRYVIKDKGSSNGTWWNGKRLAPKQPQILQDGDTIQFGGEKGVIFTFVISS